jgi:predicted O-methyltransferase YrrM
MMNQESKWVGIKSIIERITRSALDAVEVLTSPEQAKFDDIWSKIDQVEGLLVPGQEEWLFRAAQSLPDSARIVEIGSFKGRSTVCLGYACLGTRRQVFSIDRFKGVYQDVEGREQLESAFEGGFFDEWRANIERNGLLEYVTPLVGHSQEIACIWRAPIHMLFIDGSHRFEDVMADFAGFYPYLVPNGLVALHDVTPSWEGPYRAWHEHIEHRLRGTGMVSTLAYGRKPR